ncbi:hypothetical protein SEUCBS139899_008025 [Sporothrix eucalyptigena]|uniref:Uncharacterized protein n=1 Tax=Sporothrix eucalyptigena TaxID=1812306 RepID=A0ABP0C219_9PEZI
MAPSNSQVGLGGLPVELLRKIFDGAFIPESAGLTAYSDHPDSYTRTPINISVDAHFPEKLRQVAREMQHKHTWLTHRDAVMLTTDTMRRDLNLAGSVRTLFLGDRAMWDRGEYFCYPRCDEEPTADETDRAERLADGLRQALPQEERPTTVPSARAWGQCMVRAIDLLKTMPGLHEMLSFQYGLSLLPVETNDDLKGGRPLMLYALKSIIFYENSADLYYVKDNGGPMGILDMNCALLHAAPLLEKLQLGGYERLLTHDNMAPKPFFSNLTTIELCYCPFNPTDLRALLATAGPNLSRVVADIPRLLSAEDDDPIFAPALAAGSWFAFTWEDLLEALAPWKDSTLTTLVTCLRVLEGDTLRLALSGAAINSSILGGGTAGLLVGPNAGRHRSSDFKNPRQRPAMGLLHEFSALQHLTVSVDLFDWSLEQVPEAQAAYNLVAAAANGIGPTIIDALSAASAAIVDHIVSTALPPNLVSFALTLPNGYQSPHAVAGPSTQKLIQISNAIVKAVRRGQFPHLTFMTISARGEFETETQHEDDSSDESSVSADDEVLEITVTQLDEETNTWIPTGQIRTLTIRWQ